MNPYSQAIKNLRMKTKAAGKRGPQPAKKAKPAVKKVGQKVNSNVYKLK